MPRLRSQQHQRAGGERQHSPGYRAPSREVRGQLEHPRRADEQDEIAHHIESALPRQRGEHAGARHSRGARHEQHACSLASLRDDEIVERRAGEGGAQHEHEPNVAETSKENPPARSLDGERQQVQREREHEEGAVGGANRVCGRPPVHAPSERRQQRAEDKYREDPQRVPAVRRHGACEVFSSTVTNCGVMRKSNALSTCVSPHCDARRAMRPGVNRCTCSCRASSGLPNPSHAPGIA